MSSDPLPDHYKALGVERNADAAAIKSTYRKLVLKCHPDKVTDPALKQQKQEEFHKIQEAYEVLSDDQKRADYEAHLTLERLRKEKAARQPVDKTARFDVRTPGGASFTATGPSRYTTEERKPSRSFDDEDRYYEDRSRGKYDTYPVYPKNASSPRSKESKSSRPAPSDRTRSDRNKARDKETRSDRKFNTVESESSSDEKARYEAEYKRRSQEDEARKQAAESRRKAEDRRSYEDTRYAPSSQRKMSVQEEEAIRYQHKSRVQVEAEMARPSPPRASSRDYFGETRPPRKESRPEAPRRSSARPKERSSTSGRVIPEIVEWGPPSFKHSSSSPANIEVPRAMPQRSQTDSYRRADTSPPPPPAFQRSATMNSIPHSSSSRRKETAYPRPSGLRETMTPEHSPPERDAFPTVPPPQTSANKTKYYHYPTPGGGVPLRPEDILGSAGTHRTVLREPERTRHRSPSPLTRPPMGANRPSESSTAQYPPRAPAPPAPRTEERGRTRPLYGEVGADRKPRQPSYSPGDVQYSRKFGPEDVRWAPRSRENDREYASKPSFSRTATYVY